MIFSHSVVSLYKKSLPLSQTYISIIIFQKIRFSEAHALFSTFSKFNHKHSPPDLNFEKKKIRFRILLSNVFSN